MSPSQDALHQKGESVGLAMVDTAVGDLFAAYFRLRQEGRLQEEYDAMGTLISMLSIDRQHMRQKFKDRIRI